ncbi:MAG: DUF3494 domain-containing protein [Gammaproteobacteria bacterium]|nr:DUF3494 domain-containing protein [Gammaproteobacteria bacterium]
MTWTLLRMSYHWCAAQPFHRATPLPHKRSQGFTLAAAALLLALATPTFGQIAPDLGSTDAFAVVAETFSNTSAGTLADGDVCFTTGPAVAPVVTGTQVTPCPPLTGIDQSTVRAELDGQTCVNIGAAVALDSISIGGGPPGVYPPGCYSSTGAMSITTGTSITLSGDGVFLFRPGGALDPAADSSVIIADGACADNVFWTPDGGTTIGANAAIIGTVFRGTADGLSITLGDSASLLGRALAFGSTVTTANSSIIVPDPCPGSIVVEKQTNPQGSLQSFTFSGDAAGTVVDDGQIVVTNLSPGNYSSIESTLPGWTLTSIVCDDSDSSGDIGSATANFVLAAGETVTCVFINTELGAEDGTITILKQANPSDSGEAFDFGGDLGTFSLQHGEFILETRPPGIYLVSENIQSGWQLDSAECSDGSPVAAIDLQAGESVTCTFTNTLAVAAAIGVPLLSPVGIGLMALTMLLIAGMTLHQPKPTSRNRCNR